MLRVGLPLTQARATHTRVVTEGPFHGRVVYLMQSEPSVAGEFAPQAFLVEQTPGWSVAPHFHLQDEFQLTVDGSGKLGVTELRPYIAHYAARETIYGPVEAGVAGLSYLTVRAVTDSGIWPLAEARRRATPGLRRYQAHSIVVAPERPGNEAERVELIQNLPTGTGAQLWRLPPGACADMPVVAGTGRFLVLLSGELQVDDEHLDRLGIIFAADRIEPLAVAAGTGGAEFMLLDFPAAPARAC